MNKEENGRNDGGWMEKNLEFGNSLFRARLVELGPIVEL